MILTLAIIGIVALVTLWLSLMYAWYQREQDTVPAPLTTDAFEQKFDATTRMIRRGWYGGTFYTKQAAVWGNKKIGALFFTVFPRAKDAFMQKDPLVGLHEGPSSYFLKTISESKIAPKKRLIRKRKSSVEDL